MLSSLALDPSPDPSPESSPSPSPRPSEAASSAALPLRDKASALPLQDKLGEDLQSEAEIMAAYGIGGARGQKKNTPAIKLADPICIASDSECSPQKVAPNSFFREAGQSQKIKFEEMLSSFGGGGCTKYLLLRRWAPPFEEVFAWCVSFGGGAWAPPKN